MKPSILIVSRNDLVRAVFGGPFTDRYNLSFVADVPEALKVLKKKACDLCFLEGTFTGKKGMDPLKQLRRQEPSMDIIVLVPEGRSEKGLEAVQLGAYDYAMGPVSILAIGQVLERVLSKRTLEKENRFWRQELMVLFAGRETITREDIPVEYLGKATETAKSGKEDPKSSLKKTRLQFERQCIRKALERAQGNQTLAAKALGLHRNTLIWKLKELHLEAEYRRIVRKRRGK